MKRNVLFFLLGVIVTLTVGYTSSVWVSILPYNRFGISSPNDPSWKFIDKENRFGISTPEDPAWGFINENNRFGVASSNDPAWNSIEGENRLGVANPNDSTWDSVQTENRFGIAIEGECPKKIKDAMIIGFIHGIVVGKRPKKKQPSRSLLEPGDDSLLPIEYQRKALNQS